MTPRSLSTRSSDCAQIEILLGVVALKLADPADTRRVADHLLNCQRCATALADVNSAAHSLRHVSPEDLEVGLPGRVDEHQATPAARRAESAWRRRRGATAIAVAVAAIAVGIGILGVRAVTTHPSRPFAISAHAPSGIVAHGHLEATSQGSVVLLSVSGLPAYQWCQLLAVGDGGLRVMSSGWYATLAGTAQVRTMLDIHVAALHQLELVDRSGRTLIALPVPGQ